jgi:hypothetical protein
MKEELKKRLEVVAKNAKIEAVKSWATAMAKDADLLVHKLYALQAMIIAYTTIYPSEIPNIATLAPAYDTSATPKAPLPPAEQAKIYNFVETDPTVLAEIPCDGC